jgi:glycogen(starch) synthase
MSPAILDAYRPVTETFPEGLPYRSLVILARADPIICGHSTEARNLAEAAIAAGIKRVHIVSYPLDVLSESQLPLKPLDSVAPYSPGITVDRPAPVGDYKVLDGRLGYAITGHLIDLLQKLPGPVAVMNLYLVPHGQMVMQAVEAVRGMGICDVPTTIAEAVGSDITNVVSNALQTGQFGAAAAVLQNFLMHDQPVAVSRFTKELIIEAGEQVDRRLGTSFAPQLAARTGISYPAIDTSLYLQPPSETEFRDVLSRRGLVSDGYVLFLSRLAESKGVDDLITAYQASRLADRIPLVICGTGPHETALRQRAAGDQRIRFFNDVSDAEKRVLMASCHTYCLPSKPRPEFTETFGIAIVEAMLAAGRGVVVTTRTGGIPEATGNHCLYHAAGDVAELTMRLNDVAGMDNAAREALAHQARQYARQFDRRMILHRLLAATDAAAAA